MKTRNRHHHQLWAEMPSPGGTQREHDHQCQLRQLEHLQETHCRSRCTSQPTTTTVSRKRPSASEPHSQRERCSAMESPALRPSPSSCDALMTPSRQPYALATTTTTTTTTSASSPAAQQSRYRAGNSLQQQQQAPSQRHCSSWRQYLLLVGAMLVAGASVLQQAPSAAATAHNGNNGMLAINGTDSALDLKSDSSSSSSVNSTSSSTSSSSILNIYTTANHSINFTHLALDHWGNLYVGAANWIYRLNGSTLAVLESVRTGPVFDSPLCSPSDCSGVDESSISLRANLNKVLLVDELSASLLVCGTVHQGACRRHRLGAIATAEELIPLPVAANDENSSTLAFVGPSRFSGSGPRVTPVLYVAATNSRLGPYRDMVPAIASRSLETAGGRYLSLLEKSFTDSAKIDIEYHMKDYFLVHYVYGFASQDFVYFATVQRRSHLRALEEWGYISRLGRVCQSDAGYSTYTEVTLQCTGPDGAPYPLLQDATLIDAGDELARSLRIPSRSKLLVGVFSAALEHTSNPDRKSAVCVYTLQEIEQKFAQNIHMCYNGSVASRNMEYIAGNLPDCPSKRTSNIVSFCSETLKINGSVPISRTAAATYPASTLTSVLGQVTSNSYNVLFAGTHDGKLKKLLLSNIGLAEEFDQVTVDEGHGILPDMLIDTTGKYLYVASPYKIVKVLIKTCPGYSTCRACLNSRNPYCGWCSLQKTCTLRSNCIETRSTISSRWLSVDSNRCVEFQSIYPENMPVSSVEKVKLVINQLPRLPRNVTYQCVFGSNAPIEAEPMPNGLICQSPPVSQRPRLSSEQDFISVDLSIRPSDSKTDFLQRKFIFYDCNFYKTCTTCVQCRWGCQWCFKENRCVSSGYLCGSQSSNYSTARYPTMGQQALSNSQHQQVIRNKESCPSFNLTHRQTDISLPSGVTREITLPIQNVAFGSVLFGCIVTIEGRQNYVHARVESSNIICSPSKFEYVSENSTGSATVTAVWNKSNYIDQINVTLYKCRFLGAYNDRSDCSICLNLDRSFECGWCGGACVHASECREPLSAICPPPRIDWIHPLSGPISGGTVITVEGSNLGTTLEEIRDKVLIGGQPCQVTSLNISVAFSCVTRAVGKPMLADVVVGNRAGFSTARDKFLFAQPELLSSYPNSGPHSGGTRIYIIGKSLSIGTSLEVFLDEHPCLVEKMLASSTQISCRTTAAKNGHQQTISRLIVKIDNATLSLDSPFRYLPDPTIQRIYPLKSYVSGGRSMTVVGTNFDTVQQPRMAIFGIDGSFINDTVCEVLSAGQMSCPSPPVNAELIDMMYREQQQTVDGTGSGTTTTGAQTSSSFSGNGPQQQQEQPPSSSFLSNEPNPPAQSVFDKIALRIGFIMDGVMTVRDLAANYPTIHSDLVYVPDPKVFQFEEGIKDFKGDSLVIEGENLRLASSDSEVNVTIGTALCNLTSLAPNQIFCIPPEEQPEPTDEFGRRTPLYLPLVVAHFGSSLRYEIGYLRYDSAAKAYEISFLTIGFIVIFSVILITFVLVSFVFMRHKSLLAEREYKRIQMQMDTLENSVRSECKQAFAELQTDMTDLSNDLENCGIPILDHRTYVMKVFFPGVHDHPLLQFRARNGGGGSGSSGSSTACAYNIYELAMAQFEQLIYNKQFLLCFLNTLESSQSFNIRDRVNVASLLMVILMERMEYATDILRTLLFQLVEKSVNSKYPQLMLRRTESVVEKMLTNWLSLTMYDYMKNYAGSQLFLLFSAIKHQIEKGPIDAVTHDARYSLSEERLLREHYCNYEQMFLVVALPDRPHDKYHVRVNDCDTISQVKGKVLDVVYKNTPFSCRPAVGDFELQWRDPCTGAHLQTLQDTDQSTKREQPHHLSASRLNTLKHYGVKSMALVTMVPRQQLLQQHHHQQTMYGSRGISHHHHQQGGTLYLQHSGSTKKSSSSFYPLLGSPNSSVSNGFGGGADFTDSDHFWHLVKPSVDEMSGKEGGGSSSSSSASVLMHKAIPEIFLTRLLSTKGTIQKFVDDFFRTILVANDALPVSVKWIFDLLDEAAVLYNILDPDVVHAWKSNCLPLRFWVNFIKNPNFIVDINKTATIDSNLSVIAQTLMDSCSSSDPRLGKDSPSSKLLFAKDIITYRKQVLQFYHDVYHMPPVHHETLISYMQSLNQAHSGEFDTVCALKELFVYAVKYSNEIIVNLQQCDYVTQQQSLDKFINLINYKF